MKINPSKIFQCFIILLKTSTNPSRDWFLIFKTIFITLIKNPEVIFNRTTTNSQRNFLTDYLPHDVIVNSPDGIIFVARPRYEDLARFLFSKIVAKWEPISEIQTKTGQIIIDVGSNVGYYTLKFAKDVGKTGKIISVEPDPDTFYILKKNCKLNNFTNVELYNFAIGDHSGIEKLFKSKTHSGKSSLSSNSDKSNDFVTVELVTLDELLEDKFPNIDWLKIDVEGSELGVIKGCPNILSKTKKILLEIHEEVLKKQNEKPEEIIKILTDSGFKIRTFNEYWDEKNSQNQTLKSDYILGERID